MRMLLTTVVMVSSAIQICVSLNIFKRGSHNFSYFLFFCLSIVTLLWALLNYISIISLDSTHLTYIVRAILFFASIQITLFYLFAHSFPNGLLPTQRRGLLVYILLASLTSATTLSPYIFEKVSVNNGIINTQIGFGILAFMVFLSFSVFYAFRILITKFCASVGMQRKQLLIVLLAASLNWILIPITNFALTLIFNTPIFAMVSPIYSLVFSSIIAYALSKHHLFDNRRILRNSTIYVDYSLKNNSDRSLQYYELQTLVYNSGSSHIALDFSSVEDLDPSSIKMFKILRSYMEQQGKKVYFINYTKRVFDQLKGT